MNPHDIDITNGTPTTTNVVYRELLLRSSAPSPPTTTDCFDVDESTLSHDVSDNPALALPTVVMAPAVQPFTDSDVDSDDLSNRGSDPFGYYSNDDYSDSDC